MVAPLPSWPSRPAPCSLTAVTLRGPMAKLVAATHRIFDPHLKHEPLIAPNTSRMILAANKSAALRTGASCMRMLLAPVPRHSSLIVHAAKVAPKPSQVRPHQARVGLACTAVTSLNVATAIVSTPCKFGRRLQGCSPSRSRLHPSRQSRLVQSWSTTSISFFCGRRPCRWRTSVNAPHHPLLRNAQAHRQ